LPTRRNGPRRSSSPVRRRNDGTVTRGTAGRGRRRVRLRGGQPPAGVRRTTTPAITGPREIASRDGLRCDTAAAGRPAAQMSSSTCSGASVPVDAVSARRPAGTGGLVDSRRHNRTASSSADRSSGRANMARRGWLHPNAPAPGRRPRAQLRSRSRQSRDEAMRLVSSLPPLTYTLLRTGCPACPRSSPASSRGA
jgi:hypothetical protein